LCAGDWKKGENYWNDVSEDTQNGLRVRRINLNWKKFPDPSRYLYDNPAVARYLEGMLPAEKFDIVHVTSCETLSASVFRAVKNAGLPLVFSITDFWMLCPRINLLRADGSNCLGKTTAQECLGCVLVKARWYRGARKIVPEPVLLPVVGQMSKYPFLTRRRGLRGNAGNMGLRKSTLKSALTLPDYRVTASNFVRDIYISNGVQAPIAVEPYGHDLGWLSSYTGKSQTEVLRLGFIGQIIRPKGVHLILEALALLPPEHLKRLSLIIYGNMKHMPPYGRQIQELAAPFPMVTFGKTYPHAESARVFSDIDVLLVPSLWFDFPLIIYEAFATQTPVIATNLGGMAEAVSNGVNGLLFERGDPKDLAQKIKLILDTRGLLENLRQGVPKVRTVQEEADTLEQRYRELVHPQN
jgi:glycosyltransferase involved in cell wall biosynthesis